MNCVEWEERVALYAGGDLKGEEAVAVERHLSDCAGCQVFASGLRQALETLQEAHAGPLPEPVYTAIRARVMARVMGRRRRPWIRGAAAVAAASVLVVLGVEFVTRPLPPAPVAAVRIPPAPAEAFRRSTPTTPAVRRIHRPALSARTEPLLIRMVTDNPDVVIYWIAETKGY